MEQKENLEKYSIGLDIGTNSVGWCVTDSENNILEYRGRKMWGVRLFSEGETAVARRISRSARRRLDRRRGRIIFLQELIGQEVLQKDSGFFQRLKDAFYYQEDRKAKNFHNLFVGSEFTDRDFYRDYPTIFHLRKKLMESDEQHDIRLVYLAIHHILKYRGNFLYEEFDVSEVNTHDAEKLVEEIIGQLNLEENEAPNPDEVKKISAILGDISKRRADKREDIAELIGKNQLWEVLKCALGYKVKFNKMFGEDSPEGEVELTKEGALEQSEEKLGELFGMLESINTLYSSLKIREILGDDKTISDAMLRRYKDHKKDLKALKSFIKEHCGGTNGEIYTELFKKDGEHVGGLYGAYIEHTKNREAFVSRVKTVLESLAGQAASSKDYVRCKERIQEEGEFLQKIGDVTNGVIPHQLHRNELQKILEKQSQYYPLLKENTEKIITILEFRIPYYVGPLNTTHAYDNNQHPGFAWAVRKSQEPIFPWNFDDAIDKEASAERFINRMRNSCTYLPGEDTLPRHSLLYSEFAVLNELNKVRVGKSLVDKRSRELVLNEIFKKQKTVSKKKFINFLRLEGCCTPTDEAEGFQGENGFANGLVSYVDMTVIFGEVHEHNFDLIEDIIKDITLFEDKKLLKNRLQRKLEGAGIAGIEEKVEKLSRLTYRGWGNLSAKLLTEIKCHNGESIIERLRQTNDNLMEIVEAKELEVKEKITEIQASLFEEESIEEAIDGLPGSPANKKAIRQTFKIVEEIISLQGKAPEHIFLEWARDEKSVKGRKGRTKSRVDQLMEIYGNDKDLKGDSLYKDIQAMKKAGDKQVEDKAYLYFMQNGKCAYTGEPLSFTELQRYHIDHILPQALIKDDSLDNKVLVKAKSNVLKLDAPTVPQEARERMKPTWEMWRRQGLLSSRKFYNLTRTEFKESDFEGFINRQLVETRQIIKHVTNLFGVHYSGTKVFALRASLASDFRKQYNLQKSRLLNDFHHAHDAYILSIIGNTISRTNPWLLKGFEYGAYIPKFVRESGTNNTHGIVIGRVSREMDDQKVGELKKRILHRDIQVTKQLESSRGEFYNQTKLPKGKGKVPLKTNLDPQKYGGYAGVNEAYYTAIQYEKGATRKKIKELLGVPVHVDLLIKSGKQTLGQYIDEYCADKGYCNPQILADKILKYQRIEWNSGEYLIVSSNEIINARQLVITEGHLLSLVLKIEGKNGGVFEEDSVMLNELFDLFCKKLRKAYPRYESLAKRLEDLAQNFYTWPHSEKVKELKILFDVTGVRPSQVKSSLLNATGVGRLAGINFDLNEIQFVSQSVTGLLQKKYSL